MERELEQINNELDEASRCLSFGQDEQGYLHLGTACALLDALVASTINNAAELALEQACAQTEIQTEVEGKEAVEVLLQPEPELALAAAA